jgi:type IV secretory pathway VirB4 component
MLKARATQEFVPIKEVRDGTIILKNGELRAIILANSINLSLKSDDEQKATILQFQSFLNTLDFPVQISVQSRRLDIRPYLLTLEEKMKTQTEPLLKLQTKEYIEFIRNFTETVSIMTKSFFIVIPYSPATISATKNPISKFLRKEGEEKILANEQFEEYRSQLEQRTGVVEQGLVRCGIRVAELGTEEVVELYYKIFNPGETEKPIQIN